MFAAAGAARASTGLLLGAAVTGFLVALLSITGPELFVVVPGIMYGVAAVRMPPER